MENGSIFEKTMGMCLESKRASKAASKKSLVEGVKKANTKSKKLTEDVDDPENLDVPVDTDTDMNDTVDDIVVVVDPELDADMADDFASELQDIVDGTPDGETPTIDDYVGDLTYTCPICANTFFSDHEMTDGEACPVCGETPTAFVLAGSVADADEAVEDTEEPVEDHEDVDDTVTDEPEGDEDLEPVEPEEDVEDVVDVESKKVTSSKKPSYIYSIDESTFNPFMTKFIRENYKNANSFKIVSAKRSGRILSLECRITFKSGKTKNVTLRSENFVPKTGKSTLSFKDNGVFKNESKRNAPFVFETVMTGKTIKCSGLKYNFITTTEGKRVQISGNLIRESKKAPKKRA